MQVSTQILKDDGRFPNNGKLPVIHYRQALPLSEKDPAADFEQRFSANGWEGMWRNGIYDYHHYHSTAHEILGVARGSAEVILGGPNGQTFQLTAGDAVLLPAGVSHCCLHASDDFQVVGAYPAGQHYDMNYGKPDERPAADRNIERLQLPGSDPVTGTDGPLQEHWQ